MFGKDIIQIFCLCSFNWGWLESALFSFMALFENNLTNKSLATLGSSFFWGIPIEIAEKFNHGAVTIQDTLLNQKCFCFVLIQFSKTQQSTCRQQSVQFPDLVFE